MSDYAAAHASGSTHAAVARECAARLGDTTGHTLGFVYATTQLNGGFGEIVTVLRRETGVPTWVGTAGMGVSANGAASFDEPGVVALTCRIPETAFRLQQPVRLRHVARSLAPDPKAAIGIVHADPRNSNLVELVATIARTTGIYYVGGLSVGTGIHPQALGNRIADGGISGVVLGGDGAPRISVGLTQDCAPIGTAHAITRCDGRVIAELDGRPAFEVLREDAGAGKGDDPRHWLANVQPAQLTAGSDLDGYMVHNLAGIDAARGLVAIGAKVETGDRIVFVRRSREAGERDLARVLADVKARAGSPKAALYYSCITRGPRLFADAAYEIRTVQASLGGIPAVGFYGNGEIANDRVHSYAGVVVVLS